jgi:hypothetical protein
MKCYGKDTNQGCCHPDIDYKDTFIDKISGLHAQYKTLEWLSLTKQESRQTDEYQELDNLVT